jgi:hypothetical protein
MGVSKYMEKNRPSLLSVPMPLIDESPASWLLRICQLHQCSMQSIHDLFEIERTNDPDLNLTAGSLISIAYGTQVQMEAVERLGRAFSLVRRSLVLRKQLYCDRNRLPLYRFCYRCLANDATPYWRIAWRFAEWKICPIHMLPMQDRCPHCGGFLTPNNPNLKCDPTVGDLPICIKCPKCYKSLVGKRHSRGLLRTPELRRQINIQRVILVCVDVDLLQDRKGRGLYW